MKAISEIAETMKLKMPSIEFTEPRYDCLRCHDLGYVRVKTRRCGLESKATAPHMRCPGGHKTGWDAAKRCPDCYNVNVEIPNESTHPLMEDDEEISLKEASNRMSKLQALKEALDKGSAR